MASLLREGGRAALLAALAAASMGVAAQGLPKDSVVRVKNPSLGASWLEGKVGVATSKCTMVYLYDKAPGGYTSIALSAVEAMQKRDGAGWADVDIRRWLANEPKDCREADND